MDKYWIEKIADFTRKNIDLANAKLSDEYFYNSLPLCVIDAVFSIGVNYSSTRNTVIRFCDFLHTKRVSEERKDSGIYPPVEKQLSIQKFLDLYEKYSIEEITVEVFKNRQRTSTTNGILKSDAVKRFSEALRNREINYLQDANLHNKDEFLYSEVKNIPGQTSGISLQYFFMLAGSDEFIKPDKMVRAFIENIIG